MRLEKKTKAVCSSLVAMAALFMTALSGQALAQEPQKQNPEVQQLKDRVKQLEENVEALKAQITAIENADKTKTDATAGRNVATTAPATTDKTGVITNVAYDPNATNKPPKQDKEGENTFEVYGFVMLDAGYQFKTNHPDWFDVIRVTKLPSFPGEFAPNGHTFFGVRQSRFGVKSSTPTKLGELKTQFEFELFGTGVDAGQTTFRLRHAYGELGQFGAGQTNSVFMDGDVFPNSIEYWGPTGMPFFRNVQVRWMPIKGRSRVTIALERPGASADQGDFADRIQLEGVRPRFAWPDLTWEARYGKKWGYVEIAGILGSMAWRDTNVETNDLGSSDINLSGSDIRWGFNLSSNLNFTKKDVGRFEATYGEGIENYMNDSPVDVGVKILSGDPQRPIKGVALPVFGMVAFLDHTWNKKFSSTVGYSMQNITNSSGQPNSAFHRGHYALGNLLWYPIDNVMVGGEFQWGRRENWRDGFASDDFRIQFSFKYNFSKMFKF